MLRKTSAAAVVIASAMAGSALFSGVALASVPYTGWPGDDGDRGEVINNCSVVVVSDSSTTTGDGTSSVSQTATATNTATNREECTVIVVPGEPTTPTPPPFDGGSVVIP